MEQTLGSPSTSKLAPAKRPGRARRSARSRREAISFYLFISPWLLGFILLTVFPLVLGFLTSLSNYDGLNLATVRFVGPKNYARALSKDLFWTSLANSARYAIIVVPVGITLSFLLAVMLNRPMRGRDFFRLIYYLPAILPVAGSSRVWRLLFDPNAGAVNALIRLFRPGIVINWRLNYWWEMLYLYAWWPAGAGMVIFLAGLQGIPGELYQAAEIDGANRFQQLIKITLPLMTPVVFFQLIMGIIGALQVMVEPILIYGTASGLSGRVDMPGRMYTYMVYTFVQVFDFQRYGYGVALSWIFFVIVLILTLIVIKSSKYWVFYRVSQEGEA